MTGAVPRLRWSVLLTLAVAASLAGAAVQLAFAVVAIGLVGMAHGASDLAVVPPGRRGRFVAVYLAVLGIVLAWWVASPVVALPLFLLLSAAHFATEDGAGADWMRKMVHGLLPIAAPALLHRQAIAALLTVTGGDAVLGRELAAALAAAGAIVVPAALWLGWRDGDRRLLLGTAALVLPPPLVGFSVGFLVLHAWPQDEARAHRLGCGDALAYWRVVAPVLAAAIAIVGAVALVLVRVEPSGLRSLFAGIAALAVPHMLVTPLMAAGGDERWWRPRGIAAMAR